MVSRDFEMDRVVDHQRIGDAREDAITAYVADILGSYLRRPLLDSRERLNGIADAVGEVTPGWLGGQCNLDIVVTVGGKDIEVEVELPPSLPFINMAAMSAIFCAIKGSITTSPSCGRHSATGTAPGASFADVSRTPKTVTIAPATLRTARK